MIRRQSDFFNISHEQMESRGVFDSFLDVDSRMFLDPYLLKEIDIPEFANSRNKIIKHYSDIITLLSNSTQIYDLAWRKAREMLIFRELRGVSIGYGNKSSDGSGVGPKLGFKLIYRAKEIIDMGIKDPEIFELIGLFEEDFGADRISDMTVRIIREDIFSYTQRIAKELKIKKIAQFRINGSPYLVPIHPSLRKPILFLPKKLLAPLPVALSWEEIGYASQINSEIRRRVNELIMEVWRRKNASKDEIRTLLFSKRSNMSSLIEAYKNVKVRSYDYDNDPNKEISWFDEGIKLVQENPLSLNLSSQPDLEEVEKIVELIIYQFKKLIEDNGANIHLFRQTRNGAKPAHERFVQNLFLCVADSYCKANDLDLSPEVNSGNGSIDFKISNGYARRVLVEIKLSSNTHLHDGYTEQIEAYKKSEGTKRCFYVVIRVTKSLAQLQRLNTLFEISKSTDKNVSKLLIINGLLKQSASLRRQEVRINGSSNKLY